MGERYTSSCRRVSRSELILNPKSKVAILITKMWETLGDRIALQYGGSEAHKKVTGQTVSKDGNTKNKKNKGKGTAEVLTSIRRYYSNTFTDRIKQDAMNLFLGMYQPQPIQCITALNEFHLEQKTYRELSTQQDNPKSKLKNEGKYSKANGERVQSRIWKALVD